MSETLDWTRGGTALHYQQCPNCQHLWYFERDFCPACGHTSPTLQQASGRGVVHATTLVHRAPSDEFRAIVPYQMVLVDMAEGFRVMGHAQPGVAIGDAVRCEVRQIAGRAVPYFLKDDHVA